MSSPALQVQLDPAGKVLDDPPAFLPWDRSYCCYDCCLQVRDSLGVIAIHPVLKVSPQIKIWGVQVRWMWQPLRSHLRLISLSRKRCCSHANDSFEEWGWHHPAGTTGGPWRLLSVDQVLSRTCQAPGHIARCWLSGNKCLNLKIKITFLFKYPVCAINRAIFFMFEWFNPVVASVG